MPIWWITVSILTCFYIEQSHHKKRQAQMLGVFLWLFHGQIVYKFLRYCTISVKSASKHNRGDLAQFSEWKCSHLWIWRMDRRYFGGYNPCGATPYNMEWQRLLLLTGSLCKTIYTVSGCGTHIDWTRLWLCNWESVQPRLSENAKEQNRCS